MRSLSPSLSFFLHPRLSHNFKHMCLVNGVQLADFCFRLSLTQSLTHSLTQSLTHFCSHLLADVFGGV
jgi:hypothetical protein